MALNNLLTPRDAVVINDLGIAGASLGIASVLIMFAPIVYRYYQDRTKVVACLMPLPTRILYCAILVSIPYSICFLITCSDLADNQKACKASMWGLIVGIHIMNGLCVTILLHCSLLLSSKSAQLSGKAVKLSALLIVLFALAMGTAGLVAQRYGYIADQDTCWILPADDSDSVYSAYCMEAILLYGPLFLLLLLSLSAVGYIGYALRHLNGTGHTDFSKTKSLVLRLSFPPACLIFHCFMVLGGDLPIRYHTRAAQYTSYALNYIGLASFSVALTLCAIITDPAFKAICLLGRDLERQMSRTSPGDDELVIFEVEANFKNPLYEVTQDKVTPEISDCPMNFPSDRWIECESVSQSPEEVEKEEEQEKRSDDTRGNEPSRIVRSMELIRVMPLGMNKDHVCTPDGDCCIFLV